MPADQSKHRNVRMNAILHHCHEEVFITDFINEIEILGFPSHVLFLAVNPFLNEFLGGIIVVECLCQVAQLFDCIGLVVGLNLLLRVIVERELDGLHGFLKVCGLALVHCTLSRCVGCRELRSP